MSPAASPVLPHVGVGFQERASRSRKIIWGVASEVVQCRIHAFYWSKQVTGQPIKATLDGGSYKECVAIFSVPLWFRENIGDWLYKFYISLTPDSFLCPKLTCTLFHYLFVILLSSVCITKLPLILLFIIPYYNLQETFLPCCLGCFVLKNFVLGVLWIPVVLHAFVWTQC